MLHEDVKALNAYFCDREEEVIMWLQQLDEQLSTAETTRDKQLCHIGYIHLHGQLVLLFHWSMLNYAALVKILKKHDKRSGMELKAPVLSNALRQPFSTTNVLSSLMAKCEAKARELNQVTGGLDQLIEACPQYQGLFLVKETEAALDLWTDLRTSASTPSTFLEPGLLREIPGNIRKRPRTEGGGADAQSTQPADASRQGSGASDVAHCAAAAPGGAAACARDAAQATCEHRQGASADAVALGGAEPLHAAQAGTEGCGESDTSREGSTCVQRACTRQEAVVGKW